MAKASKPIETIEPEPVRVVLPAKAAADPSHLGAVLQSLRAAESLLSLRLSTITGQLEEIAPTLPEELERMRTHLRQTLQPGLEPKELLRYAARTWAACTELSDALAGARTRRESALAVLEATQAQLAQLQLDDMRQVEHKQTMTEAAIPIRVACRTLVPLLEQAESVVRVSRPMAARRLQAALHVCREWWAAYLAARLSELGRATLGLRTPLPEDDKLAALVREASQALESPLPVPTITWPSPDKPFVPPVLEG